MEGPLIPGYYPLVQGVRPLGEPPGPPTRGPVALYGEVWRYGPRQARWTTGLRLLLGLKLPDVERVWKGPVRQVPPDVSSEEWQRAMDQCFAETSAESARLSEADPEATGVCFATNEDPWST